MYNHTSAKCACVLNKDSYFLDTAIDIALYYITVVLYTPVKSYKKYNVQEKIMVILESEQ